jgi:hypothetical protein
MIGESRRAATAGSVFSASNGSTETRRASPAWAPKLSPIDGDAAHDDHAAHAATPTRSTTTWAPKPSPIDGHPAHATTPTRSATAWAPKPSPIDGDAAHATTPAGCVSLCRSRSVDRARRPPHPRRKLGAEVVGCWHANDEDALVDPPFGRTGVAPSAERPFFLPCVRGIHPTRLGKS